MPTIMFAPPHASNKWLPLEVVLLSQMYTFSIHFSMCALLECYRYLMVWCNSYTWILNHPLGQTVLIWLVFVPIWVGFLLSWSQWGLTGDHDVTYFCGALVTIYTSGKGASEIGIVYNELYSDFASLWHHTVLVYEGNQNHVIKNMATTVKFPLHCGLTLYGVTANDTAPFFQKNEGWASDKIFCILSFFFFTDI